MSLGAVKYSPLPLKLIPLVGKNGFNPLATGMPVFNNTKLLFELSRTLNPLLGVFNNNTV